MQNVGLALDGVRRTFQVSWDDLYRCSRAGTPWTDGLTFLPYLTQGQPYRQLLPVSGAFLGLCIDHQREQLLQAALEGVASGLRAALEALPETTVGEPLRVVGGGGLQQDWRQLLADVLGRLWRPLQCTTPQPAVLPCWRGCPWRSGRVRMR